MKHLITHLLAPRRLARAPRFSALLAGAAMVGLAGAAGAQTYPTKPITMIVPFAAGGPTDIVARVIGESMSKRYGQPVIVENVAGAGGTVGAARAARSVADGHTLLMGPMSTMSFSGALYPNAGINVLSDFAPVGIVASAPILLAATKAMPGDKPADFMAFARQKGAELKYAHAGVGSSSHLACLLFAQKAKIDPIATPYRGTGPALNDVVSGHIDFICDQTTSLMGQVEGKGIKPVAIFASRRSAVLPDVPTAAEAGIEGTEMVLWNAVFAPKGTPAAVVRQIAEAIAAGIDEPAIKERFAKLGAETPPAAERGPEALGKILAADVAKWSAVIKGANVTANP